MTVKGVYPIEAEYGDRVRFATKTLQGEGTFVLAWLGIEEVWDVKLDDGHTVHVYPYFGDTMTLLGGEGRGDDDNG